MEITVLLFGGAADAAGSSVVRVFVDAPVRSASVLSELGRAIPALAPMMSAARLAVNHAFAAPEQVIAPSDEVALIAMVSGG